MRFRKSKKITVGQHNVTVGTLSLPWLCETGFMILALWMSPMNPSVAKPLHVAELARSLAWLSQAHCTMTCYMSTELGEERMMTLSEGKEGGHFREEKKQNVRVEEATCA